MQTEPSNIAKQNVCAILLLMLLGFVLDFSMCSNHGFMGDDWTRISQHYFKTEHLEKYSIPYPIAVCIKFASYDGRPFLIVPLLMEWTLFELGGNLALSLMGCFVLTLNAFLIYLLSARNLSPLLGFAIACAFICYPADTTHQWTTLACGRLGCTLSLLACLCAAKEHTFIAAILLLLSMLTYEPTALAFLAAPWLAYGGRREGYLQSIKIAAPAFAIWLVLRKAFFILRPTKGTLAESANEDVSGIFESMSALSSYLYNFVEVYWIAIIKWPMYAANALTMENGAFAFLATLLLVVTIAAIAHRKIGTSHLQFPDMRTDEMRPRLVIAFVWGLLFLLVCAVPSFRIGPTTELGLGSRGNYLLGLGVSTTLVAAVALLGRTRWLRFLTVGMLLLVVTNWGAARYMQQSRYVKEIDEEKQKMRLLFDSMKELDSNTVFIAKTADDLDQDSIVPKLEKLPNWQLSGLLRCAFGNDVSLVNSRNDAVAIAKGKRPIALLDLVAKRGTVLEQPESGPSKKFQLSRFMKDYLDTKN